VNFNIVIFSKGVAVGSGIMVKDAAFR